MAADGALGDQFGYSVSIKGTYAVVGAANDDGTGTTHVFKRYASEWVAEQKLVPADGAGGGLSGHAVAPGGEGAWGGVRPGAPRAHVGLQFGYSCPRRGTKPVPGPTNEAGTGTPNVFNR